MGAPVTRALLQPSQGINSNPFHSLAWQRVHTDIAFVAEADT